MALLSSLVGMRQKVEMPAWWALYAIWVTVVRMREVESQFLTLWIASFLAGFLHGLTQGSLVAKYRENNPWYREQIQGISNEKLSRQFAVMGVVVGIVFGAVVAGVNWGIDQVL